MIYVTGDVHADLGRFKGKAAKKLKKGRHADRLRRFRFCVGRLQEGTAGAQMAGQAPLQRPLRRGHPRQPRPARGLPGRRLLRREGAADQRQMPPAAPRRDLHDRKRRGLHLRGGESSDSDARVPGASWWPGELPDPEELAHARENLAARGNVVDYIITHSASNTVNGFLNMDRDHVNQLEAFLDEVSQTVRYKHWFFGSIHLDKVIPPMYHAVYQEILPLKGMK